MFEYLRFHVNLSSGDKKKIIIKVQVKFNCVHIFSISKSNPFNQNLTKLHTCNICSCKKLENQHNLGIHAKKSPVFGIFGQVILKPASSTTEST